MTDIFISYSRKDKEFVQRLHKKLSEAQRDTWVDWEDILPTADWQREIFTAIEAADAFAFVISPDSVKSEVCREEIQHAMLHNKRFIPLLHRKIDDSDPDLIHPAIRTHNWIFFTDEHEFDTAFEQLTRSLDTDLSYVRAHTRLLVRALEWDSKGRSAGYLLTSEEVDEYAPWREQSKTREPKPTPLQQEYLFASEVARWRRRRRFVIGLLTTLIIVLVMGVISLLLTLQLRNQQIALADQQIALADQRATAAAVEATVTSAEIGRLTAEAARAVQLVTQQAQQQQNVAANSTLVSIRSTRDALQVTLANDAILLTDVANSSLLSAGELTAVNGQVATLAVEGTALVQTAAALELQGTQAASTSVAALQTVDAQAVVVGQAPTQIAGTVTAAAETARAIQPASTEISSAAPAATDAAPEQSSTTTVPPTWTPTSSATPSATPQPSATPSPTLTATAVQPPVAVATASGNQFYNTATARDNARVWSEPDVTVGQVLLTLVPGSEVTIIGGPVLGTIRADTGEQDNWYQISQESTGAVGWVWVDRLNMSEGGTHLVELRYDADSLLVINTSDSPLDLRGLEFARILPDGSILRFISDQWGTVADTMQLEPRECFEVGRSVSIGSVRPTNCSRQGWVVRDGLEWFWLWETGTGDRYFTISFNGLVLATCPVVVGSGEQTCTFNLGFDQDQWFVSVNGSDANVCNRPDAPCGTINGALAKAQPGATINVAAGVYAESLTLNQSVTIAGRSDQQTVINGGGVGSTITVAEGAEVTLTRVTITGGSSAGDGGGVLNHGTLTILDSTISNNLAANAGGGIANFGALTMRSSRVTANYAAVDGGIYTSPFGQTTLDDTVTLEGNSESSAAANNCPALVEQAVTLVTSTCSAMDRNTACYGYPTVSATLAQGASGSFSVPGDRLPLSQLESLTLNPLDTDGQTWGIVVLNVQANLPDVLPGQTVTVVLIGDSTNSGSADGYYLTTGVSGFTCTPLSESTTIQVVNGQTITLTADGISVGH